MIFAVIWIKLANQFQRSDRKLLIEHTKLVERMDKEYAQALH